MADIRVDLPEAVHEDLRLLAQVAAKSQRTIIIELIEREFTLRRAQINKWYESRGGGNANARKA